VMIKNELNLSKEEEEILESYNADEWQSVMNLNDEISKYQDYAVASQKKDKRVNIRISTKNLQALQQKALEEGIPYQTLISSILHKFVNGRFVERR